MQVRVTLPPGSLVDYLDFCEAIAQAVCPTGEQGPEGIDCIVRKKVICHVPIPSSVSNPPVGNPYHAAWQAVLMSEDGQTLDQLLSSDGAAPAATGQLGLSLADPDGACHQLGELSAQFALTDDDRRTLEALLPELPPLRYPISEEDATAFMSAYLRLPNHPAWEPVLVSATSLENEKTAIKRYHQQMLQDELAQGRLVSVNRNHVQVAALGAGYFIPRNQAIAYLERVGFAHSDMVTGDDRDVAKPQQQEIPLELSDGKQNASTGDVQGAQGRQDQEVQPASASGKRRSVGEPKYSPEQQKKIVYECRDLEGKVRGFAKQIAKKYGYSERQLLNLRKMVDREEEEKKQQDVGRLVVKTQ